MTKLDGATWVRFGVWLVVGLILYSLWATATRRFGEAGAARTAGASSGGRAAHLRR
jgi:basic amino acid/polyamine antiporter, APA family